VSPLSIPLDQVEGPVQLSGDEFHLSPHDANPLFQTFSVAVAVMPNKNTLSVIDIHTIPETLDEFLSVVEGKLNAARRTTLLRRSTSEYFDEGLQRDLQLDEDDDDDDFNHYTRVFTHTGRELKTIEDVLSFCIPSIGSRNQAWGIATIVVSMGEDFY
jgi:hypothetical protein